MKLNTLSAPIVSSLLVGLLGGVAAAQPDVDASADADADVYGGTTYDGDTDAGATMSARADVDVDMPRSEGNGPGGGAYKWGISAPWAGAFGAVAANFLYGMNADNWLDLGVEATAFKAVDPASGDSETTLGVGVVAGYRMYRERAGRVRPYLEPYVGLGIGDFSEAGDTLAFELGGKLGADFMVFDQLSIGAALGLGARFEDSFDTIGVSTSTSSLNATIWW